MRKYPMRQKRLANYRADRQVTGFRSYKNERTLWSESQLERNTQRYYEYQMDIISFKEQPAQYAYFDDKGVERSYTPDTEITTIHGDELKETKPAIFTRSKRAKERFNHLRMCFSEAKDIKLSYTTDEEVYAGHTTENLKWIHHYHRLSIANINVESLLDVCDEKITFGALKILVRKLGFQAKHAFALLGHQVFIFDYQLPLSDYTILTATGA